MSEYNRIMLDLETLGTRPGCAILSIGAVFFSSTLTEWEGPSFYSPVRAGSCQALGLHEDADTLDWWGKQGEQARGVWEEIKKAPHLVKALGAFSGWVTAHAADPKSVQVWGNGADFDNPILSAVYHAAALKQPWGSYNGRCYRTLKALFPQERLVRSGVHHHALHDSRSQAEHAVRCLKRLKVINESKPATAA